MSTPAPTPPPADPNVVNVEVNGVPFKARKGQMIIEVTDLADIYVPRFCYHPKLSIAAPSSTSRLTLAKSPSLTAPISDESWAVATVQATIVAHAIVSLPSCSRISESSYAVSGHNIQWTQSADHERARCDPDPPDGTKRIGAHPASVCWR
jgi:hypothetical protein